MSLASALLALALSAGAALGESPIDTVEEAKSAFNRGEHKEAAAALDALYAEREEPALLHLAGIAWAACGDDTRAILRWRRYLARSAPAAEERADAERFLVEAYRRTSALSLVVRPRAALTSETQLVLTPLSSPSLQSLQVPVEEMTSDNAKALTVFLADGRWALRPIDVHPSFSSQSVEIDVNAEHATESVVLTLLPREGDLQLTFADTGRVDLRVSLTDSAGIDPPKEFTVAPGAQKTLRLRTGRWIFRVRDPAGEWEDSGDVEILEDRTTSLTLGDSASRRRSTPTRIAHGVLLGSSAITGAVGVGLVAPATSLLRDSTIRDYSDVPEGQRALANDSGCSPSREGLGADERRECVVDLGVDLQAAGAGLSFASLGLLTGVGLSYIPSRRRIPQWSSVAIGLASMLVGGVLLQRTLSDKGLEAWSDETTAISDTDLLTYRRGLVGGASLLGLGGGLTLGAGVPLLASRSRRQADSISSSLRIHLTPSGGQIRVRF